MLARIVAVIVISLVSLPAFALDACFTDSVGTWRGPVLNGTGLQILDTEFHLQSDGTLAGTYHVHDVPPFDGSLSGFHETGQCEADFTWQDHFGTGVVHIRFDPELGRFLGAWGAKTPIPSLLFDGFRRAPPAVS
jgi:hypothetical protein